MPGPSLEVAAERPTAHAVNAPPMLSSFDNVNNEASGARKREERAVSPRTLSASRAPKLHIRARFCDVSLKNSEFPTNLAVTSSPRVINLDTWDQVARVKRLLGVGVRVLRFKPWERREMFISHAMVLPKPEN